MRRWPPASDVGVWLAPADDPGGARARTLASLPVIAVDFPAFTDGRGYSTARLLRERYGYTGELRAIGDVQRDQLHYLRQVGLRRVRAAATTRTPPPRSRACATSATATSARSSARRGSAGGRPSAQRAQGPSA